MKNFNLQTGQIGEELAAEFLGKKGYKVIERNFRTRFGEIDLIVKKDKVLIFVEVKCSASDYRKPEWQISKRKIQQVKKMSHVYLATHKIRYTNLRIDAICITLKGDNQLLKIQHYKNPLL